MTLGGDFSKDRPTKVGTFAENKPTQSTNTFTEDKPTQGSAFVEDKPTSGSAFAQDRPAESNVVMDGDNTGADAFGGDFASFGELYGTENFGRIQHFVNRTEPPTIDHA